MAKYNISLEKHNWILLYDGTLAGFYSCVHMCITKKTEPICIWSPEKEQTSFFFTQWIHTEEKKAYKVRKSIQKNMGTIALELIESVFYSCLEEKEKKLLLFICEGYRQGPLLLKALDHPLVYPLYTAQRHLYREVHNYTGFVRFEEIILEPEGKTLLVSTIEPKNFVLPFLLDHFKNRFEEENWLIFDKPHQMALCYEKGVSTLVEMERLEITPGKEEEDWQQLWKRFYNTLSIQERKNPTARRNHMPKRYWSHMTEVQTEGTTSG
ncbi:MAG: DNA metabolism protein [Clostridiales bacterium]|nr:DNA metabolism protein [Clostridiales bacterium]